ncbi:hypothetical protein [Mesorhizobium delmotii]|uniref:Uncharacterized protein n=1 Tax=Mesorhizobium delmotii TaxID=1631247 RepID=A0A2P9AFJ4_9HYPH|nr:hypothetical protein [Mesorhizobium delmotii]SJM29878.1 conserved hypothetical protein [Mesorhizobium delmotii]
MDFSLLLEPIWRKLIPRDKPLLKGGFSMRDGYSVRLCHDVDRQVWAAARCKGIVNVTAVAETVRLRNLAENVALEDIECLVLQAAQFYGAAMEFDSLTVFELANVQRLSVHRDALPGRGNLDVVEDRAVSLYLRQPDRTQ